jgi:hypothetical protein
MLGLGGTDGWLMITHTDTSKTFILGIGAQRSGSTWLHSQLRKNKGVDLGLCKEYHIFDTLFTGDSDGYESRLRESLFDLDPSDQKYIKNQKLLSFLKNPENYFHYFDTLYGNKNTTKVVGDMTPSYSRLCEDQYRFIRDGLERKGFKVKVVFMMRDPVQRIWSMIHKGLNVKKNIEFFQAEDKVFTLEQFTHDFASVRTRYNRTILELEKVFPRRDIYYGFYEELFTSQSYAKIGDFLGLQLKEPDFEFKKNPSLMKGEIAMDLAVQVALHYRETYRFIHDKFGSNMKNIWPGYSLISLSVDLSEKIR